MNGLLNQEQAPFVPEVWSFLEAAATQALEPRLSARRVVTVSGPHGFSLASANTGKLSSVEGGVEDGLQWNQRAVKPLLEIRVPFALPRAELESVVRGAEAVNLAPLEDAAARVARFEETAVYQGFASGGIDGLQSSSAHPPLACPEDMAALPDQVGEGVEQLQQAGVGGPYALILEPDAYFALKQTVATGFPVLRVVRELTGGDIYWSPGIRGGVIVSSRGGDAILTLGQDISLGYAWHDEEEVRLFLLESFTFQIQDPGACVALIRKPNKRKG